MRWLRMLRLRLGVGTRADWAWFKDDEADRHKQMLQAVQNYVNELDRKEAEPTRREKPIRR